MENYEEKYNKYLGNIEKKEKSSLKRLVLLSLIPITLALLFLFYSFQKVSERDHIIEKKNEEISVYNELNQDVLATLHELNDSSKVQLDSLTREKIRMTESKIRDLPRIIFDGTQTVVRYYKRDNDDPQISKIIEDMGFYLNIRPVDDDITIGSVNVIYYGDSVKINEVELLAKELIKTKNPIRQLVNYKLSEDYKWKIRAIEIGYSERYNSSEALTEESIESILGTREEIE